MTSGTAADRIVFPTKHNVGDSDGVITYKVRVKKTSTYFLQLTYDS